VTTDTPRVRRKPPARRQFASTILTLEALVVLFATLVAYGLRAAPPGVVWGVGGSLTVVLLLLAGLLRQPGAYVAGSIAQVAVVGLGFFFQIPMMYVVGGIFVVLWVVSLRLGGRIDRERAEWDAAHPGEVSS
jgi:hypothetical protein